MATWIILVCSLQTRFHMTFIYICAVLWASNQVKTDTSPKVSKTRWRHRFCWTKQSRTCRQKNSVWTAIAGYWATQPWSPGSSKEELTLGSEPKPSSCVLVVWWRHGYASRGFTFWTCLVEPALSTSHESLRKN